MSSLFCIKYVSSLEAAVRLHFINTQWDSCAVSAQSLEARLLSLSHLSRLLRNMQGRAAPAPHPPSCQLWPEEWEQSVECPRQSWPINRSSAHRLLSSPRASVEITWGDLCSLLWSLPRFLLMECTKPSIPCYYRSKKSKFHLGHHTRFSHSFFFYKRYLLN